MTYFINYGAEYNGDASDKPQGGLLRGGEIGRQKLQTQILQPRPLILWFDPQLYLFQLRINAGRTIRLIKCMNTFPWFGMAEREQESGEFSLQQPVVNEDLDYFSNLWEQKIDQQWELVVKGAVKLQRDLALAPERIILPMPLISDPTASLDDEWRLLDEAIDHANRYAPLTPKVASLPLADSFLMHREPIENQQLESIVENVAVRSDKLAGVYIPLIQTQEARERLCDEKIAGSLLRMARLFGAKTDVKATFNFTESFGAVCKAFGADGYASGYAIRHRRFALKDYERSSGGSTGLTYPKFFSLKMCVDLRPDDLELLAQAGALEMLSIDETPASANLFAGLRAGAPVADILGWAPAPKAYLTGKVQYYEQQVRLHALLTNPETAIEWLSEAKAQWNSVRRILKETPHFQFANHTNGEHLDVWLKAAQSALSESL